MNNKTIIKVILLLTCLCSFQASAKTSTTQNQGTSLESTSGKSADSSSSSIWMVIITFGIVGFIYRDKIIKNSLPEPISHAPPAINTSTGNKKQVKKSAPPAVKKTATTPSGILKLGENATQCQATTTKGTRCSRTTSLVIIKRTINKQKCQLAVCNQHNNSSFQAYLPIIKHLL